jgi:UDP-N-acetylmuramate dehydrogenase
MLVEHQVPLQALNTFHIVARAQRLVRIRSEADVLAVLTDPQLRQARKFVLGGGSNLLSRA